MTNNINKGEKKVMDNNPTVARVNMIHDIVGDGGNGLAFKVTVAVLTFLMLVIGIALIANGRVFTGIVIIAIGAILLFTTIGFKYKRKKYRVDKKIVEDIEPLFKD
ncbi:MAG: hypothetical protein ACI4RL_03665 [Ruminococcus sp.]